MRTADATEESTIQGIKLGAFNYFSNPCDMDQLMSKVPEATQINRDHKEKIRVDKVKQALTKYGI